MNGYPAGFARLVHGALLLLFLSGLLLAPGALAMRLEWEVPWALGGGQRVWAAASHATASFLTLFLLGALWTVHMRAGWLRCENVPSGAALLGAFGLLAASGLALYYAGDESLGRMALILHLGAGLALPLMLAAHIVGALRAKSRCGRRRPCARPAARPARTQGRRPTAG
jgi:hypothetical protein